MLAQRSALRRRTASCPVERGETISGQNLSWGRCVAKRSQRFTHPDGLHSLNASDIRDRPDAAALPGFVSVARAYDYHKGAG
jgi:hypothetical protein